MKIAAAVLALVVLAAFGVLAILSGHTALAVVPPVTMVGAATPVTVQVTNPHGVRSLAAFVEQNGVRTQVFAQSAPATHFLWKRHDAPRSVSFEVGKNKVPQLKDGKARVEVEAVSNDLLASSDSISWDVTVVLEPPRVSADSLQHYINQGGMELVLLTTSGSVSESGVRVGPYTFRSFPLPGGGAGQRFAMFAYPWDVDPGTVPVVFARNLAGSEVTAPFWNRIKPKKFRAREFPLSETMIATLVNSVDPDGTIAPGPDLLTRFLKINGDLRRKNNQQLADLRFKTEEKILWNGPFTHWGKEEANFADVRDYMYQGKKVDRQVHLGFDLSDVRDAPVNAANDGRVVWAANLGIYGNCVVVDHGYALQSIYGHMKSIDVKVGDMVKKGQKMGLEGATGLAGGIHLHFSMQIDGVQTNPREWWDEHWIKDRVLSKLHQEELHQEK
jgi:murein DD-endopeptidase MepM/ murein hydrolase activator NlpD